jgi:hypothetical protein
MRWQQLFADLQAQFEEEEAALERAESASRTRAEVGAIALAQRVGAAVGRTLTLRCAGVGPITGVLVDVGPDWLLLEDEFGRSSLVAASAVRAVGGLGRGATTPGELGPVRARLDLRWALRGLARDRSAVQMLLDDGTMVTGTVDRVGADYVEVAEHPVDLPRRAEAVVGVSAVVLAAIAVVSTASTALD